MKKPSHRGLPTDDEVPRAILSAIGDGSQDGRRNLIEWLFLRFRKRVNSDRLHTCLARLLDRMDHGLVPTRPVGLLNTMLFERRCDDLRKARNADKAARVVRSRSSSFYRPDPAAALIRRELTDQIVREVFWGFEGATPAVIWEFINGTSYETIAEILTRGWRQSWTPGRVRRVLFDSKAQLRKRLATWHPTAEAR